MSQQTRVLSRTTHSNGDPLSSNDFSNLTNNPSSTPELQYTRDGTSEYVHSKCTCQIKSGFRQKSIQVKGKKGRNPDMRIVLVWRYKDTNLIMWRCSYICTTGRKSLGHERIFFGIYCMSQRRNREYDPFCV